MSRKSTSSPAGRRELLIRRAQDLSSAGNWHEAVSAWQRVLEANAREPEAHAKLGLALAHAGEAAAAVDAYAAALRHGMAADEVAAGLGIVFLLRHQYDVARENLEMAVASNAGNIRAWSNLVVTYVRLGCVRQAFEAAQRVLAAEPENVTVFSSLATLCKDMALPEDAVGWALRAAEAAPADTGMVSNLMWAMLHGDRVTSADLLAAGAEFERRAKAAARIPIELPAGSPRSDAALGPLRVGWLSSDLRNHAVGRFVVPVLEALDRTRVESFVYDTGHIDDELSKRARAATCRWHRCANLADADLIKQIRADGLDVLIDLGGHTDGSRLAALAARAAPVQMSWLGYPDTTGLSTMDYVLVPPDAVLMEGRWCMETPLALPDSYSVRSPDELLAEAGAQAPSARRGFITFGCLNNFAKVSPACVATWATILTDVPDSKLLLVATGGSDADLVADIRERFGAQGVDGTRLDIRGRMAPDAYRNTWREIDIGLDPFPFNGGTTAFDSLCMGTPYVTLAGASLHERMGANLLRAIDLPELVADTRDDYRTAAVSLARDAQQLAALHGGMYARMHNSALLDLPRFARGLCDVLERTARAAI